MAQTQDNILELQDFSIALYKDRKTLPIIRDLSFEIGRGEMLGVVGESGCGKSVTANSIMRLIQGKYDTEGRIVFEGRNILDLSEKEMKKIRGNEISMIFQEPMTSLNPTLTVGDQLMEVFITHQHMNKRQAREHALEALKSVNIAEPESRINCYPFELSGGMRQRVMIAMALACKPKLMIADEPTTALDVTIQAQILELMKELQQETGTTIMMITHDLGVIAQTCSRVIVLYCGQIMEEAPVELLFADPLHPYTKGLLSSIPQIGVHEDLYMIQGNVPTTGSYPRGCPFHPRCEHCMEKCCVEEPPTQILQDGRKVKCWLHHNSEENDGTGTNAEG